MFVMFSIISKIGINEFMACFEKDGIRKMIGMLTNNDDGVANINTIAGFGVILEIANVIMGNLHKCEEDIYKLLSQTSNMTVDEIKAPGNAVMFFEMVIDFIKKEEFGDFIQVVSRLFK